MSLIINIKYVLGLGVRNFSFYQSSSQHHTYAVGAKIILILLEKKQGFERLSEVTQQEYLRLGFKLRSV